jgi:diketogulonate reductase-like aldo/keto reductase
MQSFQTSLTNLNTNYLDSYILHSPLPTLPLTLQAWRVLISLREQGKAKMIGVSNAYNVSVLEALAQEGKIDVVQNRWYERNAWDKAVYQYSMKNGIQYQFCPAFVFRHTNRSILLKQIFLDADRLPFTLEAPCSARDR